MTPDDNNMLMRTFAYLKMLMTFCMCICAGSITMVPLTDDLYVKGIYVGFAILAMVIMMGTISFIVSLVPKDEFDALYRHLEEELERRREELRQKREEIKKKHKNNKNNGK